MIYLAGPFFNPVQVAHAQFLAIELNNRGHHVYAPVFHEWDKETEPASACFERNIDAMKASDMILAQLDYPLKPLEQMIIIDTVSRRTIQHYISLPDSGTVFEIGYAFALGKPIYGYTFSGVKQINLMLTEALKGFIKDPLTVFLPGGLVNEKGITKYRGGKI